MEHRENSVAAIRSAVDLGARFVEFDVQMSSDMVPVLMHDACLLRMYGKDRDSFDTSAQGLKALGVETLSEVIPALGEATAFVEIKRDGVAKFGARTVVDRICEICPPDQCVIISFDQDAALLARAKGFRIGFVLPDLGPASRAHCDVHKPEYVFIDQRHVTGPVWPGFLWVSYEVADKAMAARLMGYGVHLLETMRVRQLMQ
jgi:glycerophosphoryl diester phosphodiesterase